MQKYTWRPDLPDARDHLYIEKFGATPISQQSDLASQFPAPFDQGQLGSCTGNALAAALSFLHGLQLFSRLFIYRGERAIEGTVNSDSGAQIRDGIKFLAKSGCCPETEWPYIISRFKRLPAKRCYTDALPFKISDYTRLQTLDDMLGCLSSGHPFVFGFTVYESFESDAVAKTGMMPMPAKSEKVLGGHAVIAVGHDMQRRLLKVRNSWGPDWGDHGYFWMPFDYVTHRGLSDDFWTVRK